MIINRFLNIAFILTLTSLIFSEQASFSVGSIKYDYNNLKFSFSERDASMNVEIGKLQFSTANTGFEFIDNGPYESVSVKIGPSKVLLQNVDYDLTMKNYYSDYSSNHVKFSLGTFRFDLNKFDLDFTDNGPNAMPNLN